MKTTAKILFLLLLVGSIATGCKKLLDVEFDADFKATMDVAVPATSLKAASYYFSDSYTIDPTTDPDYLKYSDKIKDVEVTAITGKITWINKNATLIDGKVVVSKEGFTSVTLLSPANTPLTNGASYTYSNTDSQFENLAKILKDTSPIEVFYEGHVDQASLDYTYEITFSTTITANPLN
jgi:hypothetical protein